MFAGRLLNPPESRAAKRQGALLGLLSGSPLAGSPLCNASPCHDLLSLLLCKVDAAWNV